MVADEAVVIDLNATLVGPNSEKEGASPNFKREFGFSPMTFVDHGAGDAADQIAVRDAALAQLPEGRRWGSRWWRRGRSSSALERFRFRRCACSTVLLHG